MPHKNVRKFPKLVVALLILPSTRYKFPNKTLKVSIPLLG